MDLSRKLIEKLIYGDEAGRRQTQDSPVLPDVWIRYGCPLDNQGSPQADEGERGEFDGGLELLLTPRFGSTPGEVADQLRKTLANDKTRPEKHRVAYNQTYVAVNLTFRELVHHVLPMTWWWYERVIGSIQEVLANRQQARGGRAKKVARSDLDLGRFVADQRKYIESDIVAFGMPGRPLNLPADLVWMIRLVGSIAYVSQQPDNLGAPEGGPDPSLPAPGEIIDALIELLSGFKVPDPRRKATEKAIEVHRLVYLVNMNRRARLAVTRSTLAVKADAARRVFEMDCSRLRWAIIDSGVDARHPAFYQPADPDKDPRDKSKGPAADWAKRTRVERTFDFTVIRDLLDPNILDEDSPKLKPLLKRIKPASRRKAFLEVDLPELKQRLLRGRGVDWALLEPLLEIPHDRSYSAPNSDHGTHVGGILAADWPQKRDYNGVPLVGVCPGMKLYDFRVIDPTKPATDDDEFAVIAALQFVSYLNDQKDYYAVHGVNMSLAIPHEVANYACGRTPVCDECSRLVSTGVVVVAAAGNEGYLQYQTATGNRPGYHTVSITDPGNAESVITVGATHRFLPHTYGVSYFSSRGPTGDGRNKPDLVAPGEKIWAPIPGARADFRDGTSMAAPHVSGAAALLMARHSELAGDPARIKSILCSTATDLGRERYFQGSGMLDVLRALQSV